MEKQNNIKKPYRIGAIIVLLLLLGMSINLLKENYETQGKITLLNGSEKAFNTFYNKVVPLLDRHCSVCHGTNHKKYQNINDSDLLRWETGLSGSIETTLQARQLFEDFFSIKTDGKQNNLIEYETHPIESHLLRAGLAKQYAGNVHHDVFYLTEDPDYKTLEKWVIDNHIYSQNETVQQSESEVFFAEKVTPVLVRKNCFGCHGPMAFNDLRMDPGIPMLENRFTREIHQRNRKAMLGNITRMVHLSGDVEQSKQLLKNIPVEQGGIVHIGGNDFFEKNDPDYQVFLQWLTLEKAAVEKQAGTNLGEINGFVYVQRPNANPDHFFEDDAFHSGADIFLAKGEEVINLTSQLHPDGPADIRAPDVSYDAKSILFTMRKSEKEACNIWEMELESRVVRQITFSDHPAIHYKDPLYIPNPEDEVATNLQDVSITFVSNLTGEYCQSSPGYILGEAEGGNTTNIIDNQRTEKAGTYDQRNIKIVKGTNVGEVRKIVSYSPCKIKVDRPFSIACNSTTHYEIEMEVRMAPKYDAYRMHLAKKGEEQKTFKETLNRMSYTVSQMRRPTIRSTGEIMFTALRTGRQGDRAFFNGALFRTHVDGSNLHTHNGNRSRIPILSDDRELPNGLEIRIGRGADSYWGGMLIISDHQFGPTIEKNNPLDNLDHPYQNGIPENSRVKFVPGWLSLDTLVEHSGFSKGGVYRDPYPLPDGSVIVSYAKGPIDLHDPNANPDFDIIKLIPDPAFQSADGFRFGGAKREVLISGEGSQLWGKPVTPRLKEPVHKKLKKDSDLYGAPELRKGFTQYQDHLAASLQVSDLILLEAFFEQVTPVGRKDLGVETVKYARIIGVRPQYKGDTGEPKRFLIAEVPVAEDGSFYVQVPSKVSFDIQSLNAQKMALRSPNRWLYCQPGEKHALSTPRNLFAQSCGGCHGSLTGLKEDVLRRPDGVTGASQTNSFGKDDQLKNVLPFNYAADTVVPIQFITFNQHIQPIIQKNCISCHQENDANGLNLAGENNFNSLRKYVNYQEALAIKSDLMEILLGEELRAPLNNNENTSHPSDIALTAAEILTFIRWIDLGAIEFEGGKTNE